MPTKKKTTPEPGPALPTPRPYRVETFTTPEGSGWRLCAANGVIVRESAADQPDEETAAQEAAKESFAADVIFQTRGVQPEVVPNHPGTLERPERPERPKRSARSEQADEG